MAMRAVVWHVIEVEGDGDGEVSFEIPESALLGRLRCAMNLHDVFVQFLCCVRVFIRELRFVCALRKDGLRTRGLPHPPQMCTSGIQPVSQSHTE